MKFCIIFSLFFTTASLGQVAQFPYYQNFDSSYIIVPALPTGWSSTQNRTAGINDFKTDSSSSSRSLPKAVLSTNARISQSLISPVINFSGKLVDSLKFFERRSSTHDSGVLLEVSTDGGNTYTLILGDTLQYAGHTNYLQRKIRLPELLNNQTNTIFRWRVIGNGTGTTGTIRFDDVYVTTKVKTDLGISSVNHQPIFPVKGDSLILYTTIKNFGLDAVQNFELSLFIDANFDSTAQTSEHFITLTLDSLLQQNDSMRVSFFVPFQGTSELQAIFQLYVVGDEYLPNNNKIVHVEFGIQPFSVVVNEIMYRPTAPEPEWVEITNTSNDSINLKLWKISDRNTSVKVNITEMNYYLKKDEFAIVTKDSTSFFEVHPKISPKVFAVPSLATFNNDSDAVVIFDQRGNKIDSVNYKSNWGGGSGGKSLERLDPSGQSNLKSNWGTSLHPGGSTPGKKNSLTPKELDLSVQRIYFTPTAPVAGDEINVKAVIFNKGKQTAESFSVECYFDTNGDTIPHTSELLSQQNSTSPLSPNDSTIFSIPFILPVVAEYKFIVHISFISDEDALNNNMLASIYAGYKTGSVVINEIMYAPLGAEPEWVELFNTSSDTIELKNWKLSNRNSTSKYLIATSGIKINPHDFVVITKDTALFFTKRSDTPSIVLQAASLPTFLLNNNGDAAVLFDNRDARMDSIYYLPSWGGISGKSLERVEASVTPYDSTNWGTSLDSSGATQGKQNYLTPLEFDIQAVRIYSSKSLPNEPVNISVVIRNAGRNSALNFTINLYHDANGDSTAQDSEIISTKYFSGNLSFKDSAIIKFSWQNPGSGVKQLISIVEYPNEMRLRDNITFATLRISYPHQSLIINEIMYAPLSGMCEYVELYNRDIFPVEMRDWKIHDTPDTAGKANEFKLGASLVILKPGEFLVLSADSSIVNWFSYLSDTNDNVHLHIFNKSSLSLNNEGDNVVLKDLTNFAIDSIRYSPKWHNPEVYDVSGRALERINPDLPGNDPRNWTTNANPIGGTPGKQNSVFTSTIPTNATLKFSPNPFSPDADGYEDHCIISYHLPASTAMIRIRIFDSKGRFIRTLVNNEPSGSSGQVIWDGMNDEKQKARIGIYVVLLEAFDVSGGTVNSVKGVLVVAGQL
jgi:hypothetical protein